MNDAKYTMERSILSFIIHAILILVYATAVLSESSAFEKPIQNVHSQALVPATRQISPEVLSCKSSNVIVRGICQVALDRVNSELRAAGIAIRKDGVLFTYNDPKHVTIPTGHSCSVTAKVRHKHASAHFSSSSTLKLTGNALSDDLALRLRVPTRVYAKVDVRQRFGFRFFGKCKRVGRDTFALKANANTIADLLVGFGLNPSFRRLSNGNFELTLEPKIAALFELDDLDLKFRVSKISPITPVLTFMIGLRSSLLKSVTGLFKGQSLKKIFKDLSRSLAYDLGAPVVLGIGALPRPLEALIFDALGNIAERRIERKARGVGENVEDKLNEELKRALKLGPDGKRVYIIRGNFLDLLRSSPNRKDLFVEPRPTPRRPTTPRRPPVTPGGFRPRRIGRGGGSARGGRRH